MLYARDDDLWRTGLLAATDERLTEERALDLQLDRLDCAGPRAGPRVSPDGCWVAWTGRWQLLLLSVDDLRLKRVDGLVPFLDWAPKGHTICYVAAGANQLGHDIYIFEPERAAPELVYSVGDAGDEVRDVVWSPDGRFVSFCSGLRAVEPYSTTGKTLALVQRLDVEMREVRAAGQQQYRVAASSHLCWTADGRVITTTEGAARCAGEPVLPPGTSPDGRLLASLLVPGVGEFGVEPSTLVVRNVAGAGEGVELWRRELGFPATSVFWSPDGQYLLVDDLAQRSPIWRLRADGTGELEKISEDGYLVAVVPQWR